MDTRVNETSRRILCYNMRCIYKFLCNCWLPYYIGPQPLYQVLGVLTFREHGEDLGLTS